MSLAERNFCRAGTKSWLCHVKYVEFTQKTAFVQNNSNLFHYAGNNPVRYIDPTGAYDWETNTVEAGDTLSQITKDFNERNGTNFTYKDFAESLGLENPDDIKVGQHLDLFIFIPAIENDSKENSNAAFNLSFTDIFSFTDDVLSFTSEFLTIIDNESEVLNSISGKFSAFSLIIDGIIWGRDMGNREKTQNLACDIIGLYPFWGYFMSSFLQGYWTIMNPIVDDMCKPKFHVLNDSRFYF